MKKSPSTLLLKVLTGLLFAFLLGSFGSNAFMSVGVSINQWVISLGIFALMLVPKGVGVAAFTGLDMDDVPAALKTYISENKADFIYDLAVEAKPEKFNILMGVFGDVPITYMKGNSVLQPGGKNTFDPTADAVKLIPRTGKVRHAKVDVLLEHTEVMSLYNSWYSQVKRAKIDPAVIPFEAELMNTIIGAAKYDVRDALFNGVYNAAGTTAADTVSGLKKIVTDGIAGAGVAQLPVANIWATADGAVAITAANAMDQIKGIASKVLANKRYSNIPMDAWVSPVIFDYYCQDYAATRGAVPYNSSFDQVKIEGTNITLVKEPMLTGSNRVIITPSMENIYYLVNEENLLSNVKVQESNRDFKIMIDFFFGLEVARIDMIWTNNYVGIS
jgi:hypothetical protein